MKPPICELCGERFDPREGGGAVTFADYQPLPEGMAGHPTGLEWFCDRHHSRAESFRGLPTAEALKRL